MPRKSKRSKSKRPKSKRRSRSQRRYGTLKEDYISAVKAFNQTYKVEEVTKYINMIEKPLIEDAERWYNKNKYWFVQKFHNRTYTSKNMIV